MMKLKLSVLPQKYAVCRLDPNGHIPHWALLGDDFISLTRTRNELSIVCLQENVPPETKAERGWRCAKVDGPFGFSLSGVHASLAITLAEANISILAIATYDTDHLLIQDRDVERPIRVLEQAGHRFRRVQGRRFVRRGESGVGPFWPPAVPFILWHPVWGQVMSILSKLQKGEHNR